MENIFTIMVYVGGFLAVLGLVGLGVAVRMALKLKKDAPEGDEAKNRLQLVFAVNTAALGVSFIGLAMMTVGVLMA